MSNTKQIRKPKQYIDINYYLHSKENKKVIFYNQKCNKCGFLLLNNAYKCDRCGSYDVIDKD